MSTANSTEEEQFIEAVSQNDSTLERQSEASLLPQHQHTLSRPYQATSQRRQAQETGSP